MAAKKKKLIVLVSSTVYGSEDLLDLIYAMLTRFGYEVWMSHRGTVQTFSDRHAFENCLDAVRACDIVFSLITSHYGSGRFDGEPSITHQELTLAIKLQKPRWVLAHHDVVVVRNLLRALDLETPAKRAALTLKKKDPIDDLRVIDMYNEAVRDAEKLSKPAGNWVQKFVTDEDALLFAQAQFHRYQEVESFVQENFEKLEAVRAKAVEAKP